MAVYYAVEFPSEDSKSRGPYTVPENKVKIESGKTLVLWSVVDENGDVMEQYFEATNLKKGSKKECGEFIDHLKNSREKVEIRNKDGRSRKKPAKLDDYEDPSNTTSLMDKLPVKKPRKALFEVQLNSKNPSKDLRNFRRNSVVDEEEDENNEDLDESVVLARWKQNVAAKKKSNGFSRPNENDPSSKTKKVVKPLKANKKKSEGRTSKSAVKKAREETADSQSCEISQNLALNVMKVIRHGHDGPVEFSINVPYCSTFGKLRRQLSQMTGIQPENQLLIIKGVEWVMEDYQMISEVWSPQELVAISEKDAKCNGKLPTSQHLK